MEKWTKFLLEDLSIDGKSFLLFGKPELTSAILRETYNKAKEKGFLCSFHEASKISESMDFFEEILKMKYGKEYNSIKKEYPFEQLYNKFKNDRMGLNGLASELCSIGIEKNNPLVIFIDGIDKLFFNMDYSHLSEAKIKKLSKTHSYRPGQLFGNNLRSKFLQVEKGIIYGTVKNPKGIEYLTTLGTPGYACYNGNFSFLITKD